MATPALLTTMERFVMAASDPHPNLNSAARQWKTRIHADLSGINPWALVTTIVIGMGVVALSAVDPWHLAALLLCAPIAVAIGWIDLRTQRIPDILLAPAYLVAGLGLALNADLTTAQRSLTAFLIATGVLTLGTLAGQMGFGDVKLAGLLALLLAWDSYATARSAALFCIVVAGTYAAWLIVRRRSQKRFAFGPALLVGSLIALALN